MAMETCSMAYACNPGNELRFSVEVEWQSEGIIEGEEIGE